MAVEIIHDQISMKVWDQAGNKFVAPGSAVGHVSAIQHVMVCALRPLKQYYHQR